MRYLVALLLLILATQPVPAATQSVAWSVYTPGAQTIFSVNGGCESWCNLSTSSPTGTVLGNIDVEMSAGVFSGTVSLSATGCTTAGDTTHFQILNNTTVASLGTPPAAGTYTICIAATQAGVSNSPQYHNMNISVGPQTLAQTVISCITACIVPTGAASTVGQLNTMMSPGWPAFAGSYALVSSGGSCAGGDDTAHFSIVSGNLLHSTGPAAGTYKVCVQTSQAGSVARYDEITVVTKATTITVNGQQYGAVVAPGASFTVAVTGGPGRVNDIMQVSTCPDLGANPNVCWVWSYAYMNSCTPSSNGGSATSATCTLPAWDSYPGRYTLVLRTDNDFTVYAASTFTLGKAVTDVVVNPRSFIGGPSFSGQIGAICTFGTVCPGTSTYSLISSDPTACPTNNSSSFTLFGTTLSASSPQASGSYTACVRVTNSSVTNSNADFPVTVASALPTASNCATTPPAPAVNAAYTTQVYCLDPPNALYDQISNWLQCNGADATHMPTLTTQVWRDGYGNWEPDCGVAQGVPKFKKVTDPATGKTVLDAQWWADIDPGISGGQGFFNLIPALDPGKGTLPNSPDFRITAPFENYTAVRFKLTPNHEPTYYGCCHPDFFGWTYNGLGYPPASLDHTEIDVIESVNGQTAMDGVFECAQNSNGCNNSNSGFFSGDWGNTKALYANNLGITPYSQQVSYGWLVSTDGTTTRKHCWYANDVMWVSPPFGCGTYTNYVSSALTAGVLRERYEPIFWLGGGVGPNFCVAAGASISTNNGLPNCGNSGQPPMNWGGSPDQDTLIEYIQIWSCAAWNTYNPHDGSGVDTQVPCPHSLPLPQ